MGGVSFVARLFVIAGLVAGVGSQAVAQQPAPKDPEPALAARAKSILERISARTLKPVVAEFDAKMLEAIPDTTKLGGLWDSIVAQTGALRSLGKAAQYDNAGAKVIVFAATFERGEFAAGVAFDSDGKVGGLVVRPQPWP